MDIPSEPIALIFFGNEILLIASGVFSYIIRVSGWKGIAVNCIWLGVIVGRHWSGVQQKDRRKNMKIQKFGNSKIQNYKNTRDA